MGMYSDNRFYNELSEDSNGLSEEEMARATEVIVPAPDATPTPGNQASGNQEAADVSQEDFPSAALLPDAGQRMSLGRAMGVSAAVGVAGVCVASVLTKEDASLSRAATPDNEKSADDIAANAGAGDDTERVEVPAAPHVTISYEDTPMNSGMETCDAGDIADAGANHVGGAEAPDPLFGGFGSLCADI
ncbi:MAG: hypothetical protein MR822_06920 [Bacteroidales bacterium]|nr:hypothetical protein [Bacteroidales bacterium]MDD6960042.1 hypothetical protein [Bacteroidales bacterium]MDY6185598.1 hypothetical protein [Muribaculaceae bacterium]